MHRHHPKRRHRLFHWTKIAIVVAIAILLVGTGIFALWIAMLPIPDVGSFENRLVTESTKIYDRTGTILLYDTGSNAKRKAVALADMSPYLPQAAIAIEDSDFYNNIGIQPTAIIRAILADVFSGGYDQGASTITQQVVKNSLLTTDKTLTRKIKEWVLAIKLTRSMGKNDILETYLNETSYGGTVYGVEEASQEFFGHSAKNDSLAESAYLAAIPQAPTLYSPYGTHTDQLNTRERLVLLRMKVLSLITDAEYQSALAEKVVFLSKNSSGIRAPHFVMYVKDLLVQRYGEDAVDNGGLRVVTTLDYDMQQKAEDVITKFAPTLKTNFGANNAAMVAIDPKTGDILTMVGSKDYFDATIDGNYNVTLARRQPGSTFKPFIYATDFMKGYTPETILWDVKTEFSTLCNPDGTTKTPGATTTGTCYSPGEYDNTFEGPLTIRYALAQSRNLPAVEALYLAGIPNALSTAEKMGVTVTAPDTCGLTLVLGGCDVSLLDMTSAYGVFANDGVRNPYRAILEVDDDKGNVMDQATEDPTQVIPSDIARQISGILSDTSVRMTSLMPIGQSVGRPVAIKTGTTNDYHDVWTLGYTPSLVVGAWAGNDDNVAMKPNVAGLIISPLWGSFMSQVAKNFPPESFGLPPPPLSDNKPVLRGIWQGGVSYWKDTVSGKVATQYTPQQTRQEVVFNDVHSILYWLNKNDPQGPPPADPTQDSQFPYWEYAVARWFKTYQAAHPEFHPAANENIPTATDDVHVPANFPRVSIISPIAGSLIDPNSLLSVRLNEVGRFPALKTEVYLNGKYVMTSQADPLDFSFVPSDVGDMQAVNTLSFTLLDGVYDSVTATTTFAAPVPATVTSPDPGQGQ